MAVLDDLDLLALEDLYGFLVVAFKLDLDLCREWLGLYDHTLTVSSLYDGAYRGGVSDSLLIGLVLVSETAEESAARTGYLRGIEREVLLLRHLDGHLYKVGEEARTAVLSTAYCESAHHLRLVADTDLAQLDTCMEGGCQILYKLSEVDSCFSGEVEDELRVIECVLGSNKAHIELVCLDLLLADDSRIHLEFVISRVSLEVVGSCNSCYALERRHDLAGGHGLVSDLYSTHLDTA